jgi:argonaute-like protein implicated in RNA metabolism and viral defense
VLEVLILVSPDSRDCKIFLLNEDFCYVHFPFKTVSEYKNLSLAVLSPRVLQVRVFDICEEEQRVAAIKNSGI